MPAFEVGARVRAGSSPATGVHKTNSISRGGDMARQRSPNRDKAFEIWEASGRTVMLKDIAAQLGVSESQIRKWKNQDQWEKVTLPKKKSNVTKKVGAPKGNKNAVGNKGGSAPEGNINAVKHGAYQTIYAAYLPEEERKIYDQMPGEADLESEIKLLRLKMARLLNRQDTHFYDVFGNRHDKVLPEEDRDAGIIACAEQLEKLVKTQNQIKNQIKRRKLDEEEQQARIAKLQAEVARITENDDDDDGVIIFGGELLED